MNNHASEMNTRLDHTCHYCGKEFSHKKGLRRHIANKHEYTGIKVKNEVMEDDDFAFGGKYSFFTQGVLASKFLLRLVLQGRRNKGGKEAAALPIFPNYISKDPFLPYQYSGILEFRPANI